MNIGTPPEFIKDDETGHVYDVNDLDSFIIENFFKDGRILSRKYIKYIGQNPEVPYSKKVDDCFGTNKKEDNQPSPSSKIKNKEPKMEIIN